MNRPPSRQSKTIIAMSVLAAVTYGVIHDQVTVRICLEYFTVFHPLLFGRSSPTLIALGWGVLATFWLGLGLGLLLDWAATRGPNPPREPASLWRPIIALMVVTGLCAAVAGLVAGPVVEAGYGSIPARLTHKIPPEKRTRFLIAYAMHNTSYNVSMVGGIFLAWRVRNGRRDCSKRKTESR